MYNKTDGLIEQHIHGAFGVDFTDCSPDDLLYAASELAKCGITYFFPTLITNDIGKIKTQIKNIKIAMLKQKYGMSEIAGIHLEGPFINPQKKGVHKEEYILPLKTELFDEIYDDTIKIMTIAPELDSEDYKFCQYVKSKGIKLSAGHTMATDISQVCQLTHIFNGMEDFSHRQKTTPTEAFISKTHNIELIADSVHVNDDLMRIVFTQNYIHRTLLISDALPLAHADFDEMQFAGNTIKKADEKIVNENGTLAGSALLLNDIIKNVVNKGIFMFHDAISMSSYNQSRYHKLPNNAIIQWDEDYNIEKVNFL